MALTLESPESRLSEEMEKELEIRNLKETVGALRGALEKSLRQSSAIIALDRFMADRIAAKGVDRRKIHVVAPWAHENEVRPDTEGSKIFRKQHGLGDSFVVMYSGNHSPIHPLKAVNEAARILGAGPEGDRRPQPQHAGGWPPQTCPRPSDPVAPRRSCSRSA